MIRYPVNYVTTDQVKRSHQMVKDICGAYGPTHPKCKSAVDDDTDLYIRFMKQFQCDDDDDTE
mgnify:CR=1 FL=1